MSSRRTVGLRYALWLLGLMAVAGTVVMVANNPFTTFGGMGPWWRAGEAAAAGSLIIAAVLAAGSGRRSLVTAAAATAFLLMAVEWGGWASGPAWLRNLADASAGPLVAAATTTVMVGAGVASRLRRPVLAAAAGGAASFVLARVVLVDPFRDPRCWRLCTPNPLAATESTAPGRVMVALGTAVLVGSVVVGVVLVAARGRRWIVGIGGAAMLGGLATSSAAALTVTVDPHGLLFRGAFVAAVAGAAVVAAGVVLARLREWRLRVALYGVVDEVRAALPGSLEPGLARALDDPNLRLLYWSPAQDSYVDLHGQTASVRSDGGRTVTTIMRRGEPVALLEHDRSIEAPRIERVIGPAFRLMLENEQLRAATLAELAELRASRARIVERADLERRRLERNLHDGAQQRIVGIALLLRALEARRPATAGRDAGEPLLRRADQLVATTLDDLRQLARGIHPAALTDGGLIAAVSDLAETSTDLAIRLDALPPGRYPPGIEAAAYLVVNESVADARRRAATTLSVCAGVRGGTLVVELVDDGPQSAAGHATTDLDDRVGALGGRLMVAATGTGTRVCLELPCAS